MKRWRSGEGPNREFEGREQQRPPSLQQFGDQAAAGRAVRAAARAPLGEPGLDFDVRSVYDSRPLNGFDFNVIPASQTVQSDESPTFNFLYQIPQGYVGVLREVTFWTTPPLAIQRPDILLTLRLQDGDFPENVDIPVGNATSIPVRCFIIADENQFVGARVQVAVASPGEADLYCLLYGNLLAKTGVPHTAQIANPK